MSDRVIVLSHRPATVRKIYTVDFEMENRKIGKSTSLKALPIAYYLEGRKDLALWRLNYYIQDFETYLSACIREDENSHFTRGTRNELKDYLEFAEKLKKVMEIIV